MYQKVAGLLHNTMVMCGYTGDFHFYSRYLNYIYIHTSLISEDQFF